jgi:hypothetical protein
MTDACWYYCDVEKDPGLCSGPVSLDRLAELIRSEELPYNVLVSTAKAEWEEADSVETILRAIPIDRDRVVREYIEYGETDHPEWGWASARMYNILDGAPELAWELILDMIDRAPSDNSLGFVAASPLEDLLSKDGATFIARVEHRARQDEKFRRALGMLRRLGMTAEVWERVTDAARKVG